MDDIKDILSKRLPQQKKNTKLHSAVHALADEISTAFGERKRFAMYLGVINRVGPDKARAIFRKLQLEGTGNLGKLFMYLCRKEPKKADDSPKETPA